MKEQLRENYFVLLRVTLLFVMVVYIVSSQSLFTGASVKVLLLLALFIGMSVGKELVEGCLRLVFLLLSAGLLGIMFYALGNECALLGIYLGYEILNYFRPGPLCYLLPPVLAFVPGEIGIATGLVMALFMGALYYQHDFVVESYRKQTNEDTLMEQSLKHNMNHREHELREEAQKSLLRATNQALEERAELSQTLHDKLGHNINDSIYQLEAVKVLMDKEPEISKKWCRP